MRRAVGYELMRSAIAQRPNLRVSNSAMLVLVRMALVALDDGRPPEYFGGWRALALMLGHEIDGDGPLPPGAEQAVARAVRELSTAGLVKRSGRRDGSVRYALLL